MQESVVIEEVKTVTRELVDAMNRLLRQLTASPRVLDSASLSRIISCSNTTLFVARGPDEPHPVIGTLTLVTYPIPTGIRAWIEDVVVDENRRNQGIGNALNRHALDCARRLGADTVNLTSRPNREAANRLYRRIGFKALKTVVYRYIP